MQQENQKQKAFNQAYEACHEPFLRYCSAIAFGKMDVEDLVQDVLLSAYKHFDTIENQDKLLHYLMRAARNRISSFWRKPRIQEELAEKHSERLVAQGVSPETVLDVQLLYRALDRLPKLQRQAVILFEVSGFSIKEIAQLQDSSEGAVKTKISRGREKLRAFFDEGSIQKPVQTVLQTIQTVLL